MSPETLARELGIPVKSLRTWLRRTFPRHSSENGSSWDLTREQVVAVRAHNSRRAQAQVQRVPDRPVHSEETAEETPSARPPRTRGRSDSDEAYVIDLCDELLGEKARRQHRFTWLVGDPGANGVTRPLRVDAFYERRGLVVEYRERQHDEPVPFFDRRQTVSGVGRGEQRRIYDSRREGEIPKRGLHLLIVRPAQLDADGRGRLRRNRTQDRVVLASLLEQYDL